MVTIRFPSALQNLTKTPKKDLSGGPATVREIFEQLSKEYGSEFDKKIFDGEEVRRFINVFVNGENIRHLSGLDTEVKEGDEISLLPAVSGG